MILDRLTAFSSAQALTATAASDDVYDLAPAAIGSKTGVIGFNIDNPSDFPIIVNSDGTDPLVGPGTLAVEVQTSDDATFAAGVETFMTSGPVDVAALEKGAISFTLPDRVYKRYLRLNYVVAGGDFTAGTVSAHMTPDASNYRTVARGYVID